MTKDCSFKRVGCICCVETCIMFYSQLHLISATKCVCKQNISNRYLNNVALLLTSKFCIFIDCSKILDNDIYGTQIHFTFSNNIFLPSMKQDRETKPIRSELGSWLANNIIYKNILIKSFNRFKKNMLNLLLE